MIDEPVNSPLISVVMPLYNDVNEVRRAVHSVLLQSVSDFELIVVNDGSTDGGEKIVRETNDARIRVVDQENKGVSAARNRGIAVAKGEVVAFLDADDEWKSDFLETILRLRERFSSCSVFATHYVYREVNGNARSPMLRRVPAGMWEGILDNYFEVAACSDPPIWSSAVAVRKAALLSVGGFPERIAIGEDLLTWARLAAHHQIAYSKKQCAIFWLRAPLAGYPTRRPEIPDRVGEELLGLLPMAETTSRGDFLRYVSLWHKMRASMFVELGDRANALTEIRKMAHYSAGNPLLPIYFIMAVAPEAMRKIVLKFFNFVRTVRRRLRQ